MDTPVSTPPFPNLFGCFISVLWVNSGLRSVILRARPGQGGNSSRAGIRS